MAKSKKLIKSVIADEAIINKIYLIRGKKVMLDKDLAEMYEVETRVLNQAVKRNIERFPERFHVSVNQQRVGKFEVTNCDFKLGWRP